MITATKMAVGVGGHIAFNYLSPEVIQKSHLSSQSSNQNSHAPNLIARRSWEIRKCVAVWHT